MLIGGQVERGCADELGGRFWHLDWAGRGGMNGAGVMVGIRGGRRGKAGGGQVNQADGRADKKRDRRRLSVMQNILSSSGCAGRSDWARRGGVGKVAGGVRVGRSEMTLGKVE